MSTLELKDFLKHGDADLGAPRALSGDADWQRRDPARNCAGAARR